LEKYGKEARGRREGGGPIELYRQRMTGVQQWVRIIAELDESQVSFYRRKMAFHLSTRLSSLVTRMDENSSFNL
jgi:hypothetical protein